jgi:GNAT superfamily N-acetyltransferase
MQAQAESTKPGLELRVRPATADDGAACGQIFYDAFESIAVRHSFPVEPGSPDFTRMKAADMLGRAGFAGLVAEGATGIVGCAFVDERGPVVGVGPVVVDPAAQDDGVGRALMQAVLERESERRASAVRLVQTAYHYRSFALYAKLGFVVREPLSVLQGPPPSFDATGFDVRPAQEDDLAACEQVCIDVHGHERTAELRDAIEAQTARVVERGGRIFGYATGFGYGWHAVAQTDDDLMALLASADAFMGLGVFVPSRNARLLGWCLNHGLQIVQQSTLMTIGLYNEPAGAWLPSISF